MRNHLLATALAIVCACAPTGRQADSAATPQPGDSAASVSQPPDTSTMSDGISVRTDKESYRPGETVQLTIVNGSGARYTYNPCTRIVERDSAGAWTPVREERMCTMIAHLLEPKATRNEQTEMAEGIAPGRYRLVLQFADDDPASAGRSIRAATAALSVASR